MCNIDEELEKAKIAVRYGADTVMDLSTGITESNIQTIRKHILEELKVPIGTVPIYQSALRAIETKGAIIHMDEDDMFNVVEEQAKEGVDFFTASNGEDALNLIVDEKPDLVFLDVMMPKMNGLEVCRKVKLDLKIDGVSIIILTAKGRATPCLFM